MVLLGASKRYDSVRLLKEAASSINFDLELMSIELSKSKFHPIAELAEVIEGPSFSDPDFVNTVKNLYSLEHHTIFVPFMDAAAVAISGFSDTQNVTFLVPKSARLLSNKISMKKLAFECGVRVIPDSEFWPKIVKPAYGFGSREIQVVRNLTELQSSNYSAETHVLEDYLDGVESTIDVYFSRSGELHSVLARDRLLVEGGEIVHTKTRTPDSVEFDSIVKFSEYGLVGPLNFQFILSGSEKYLMEINPRLSGGSTASIRAGWEAWRWMIEEYLEMVPLSKPLIRNLELFRTRRDHWRYL